MTLRPCLPVLCLPVLCLALLPSPPIAAAAERGSELVVFSPGVDPLKQRARGNVVDSMPITDLFPADGLLARLYGAGRVETCAGAPSSSERLATLVTEAEELLLNLENEQAGERLTQARSELTCVADVMPTELLTDLFLLSGLERSYAGENEAAVGAFAQSLAVDPSRSWDASYPPSVYIQYLRAMEQHYNAEPAVLRVEKAKLEVLTATLDGRRLAPGATERLSVGQHIVQLQADDGTVTTFRFWVEPSAAVLLATDAAMASFLAQGPRSPYVLPVTGILAAAADLHGVTAVQVLTVDSLHRYVQESGLFKVLREPLNLPQKINRTGYTMAAVGGAVAGVGLIMAAATSQGEQPHPIDPNYLPKLRSNQLGGTLVFLGTGLFTVGVPMALLSKRAVKDLKAQPVISMTPGGGVQVNLAGELP